MPGTAAAPVDDEVANSLLSGSIRRIVRGDRPRVAPQPVQLAGPRRRGGHRPPRTRGHQAEYQIDHVELDTVDMRIGFRGVAVDGDASQLRVAHPPDRRRGGQRARLNSFDGAVPPADDLQGTRSRSSATATLNSYGSRTR